MNKMGIFVREQAEKVRLVRQHYALTFCVARHSWITIVKRRTEYIVYQSHLFQAIIDVVRKFYITLLRL